MPLWQHACLTVDGALCDSARLHVCLGQVYMNVMIRICVYIIWYFMCVSLEYMSVFLQHKARLCFSQICD